MAPQNTAGLIRLGVFALPLAALLVLVSNLASLNTPDPGDDPIAAALAASSTGYFLIQLVGNVLGIALAIFGFFALFAYLVNTSVGRLATLGMVLTILGLSLILSFQGVVTYAIPALAQEYLNGQQNALDMTNGLFSAQVFTVIILGSVLQFIGLVSSVLPSGAQRRYLSGRGFFLALRVCCLACR